MSTETKQAPASRPDYRNIEKKDATSGAFPAEMSSEYRVHITEDAYLQMKSHASTTTEVELCGVLLGDVRRDNLGFFLTIDAVIEGKHANNYGAQVTFTHQTWDHIHAIKDKQFPNKKIVGWYHTHPGFGVFLSGMDVFIQENYFNVPFQVAIVIETKAHEEGCFAWVEGKSTPLSRYWVGNREVHLVTGKAEPVSMMPDDAPRGTAAAAAAAQISPFGGEPLPRAGSYLLPVLMSCAALLIGMMFGKAQSVQEIRQEAMTSVESEVYSLFEYSALNTVATTDLALINDKIKAAAHRIEGGQTVPAAELKDLSSQIDRLSQLYASKRSNLRAQLADVMKKKQNLSDRVEATSRRQDELSEVIAILNVARATEMAQKSGKLEEITPADMQLIRLNLDSAMKLKPEVKSIIDPRLLEHIYGLKKEEPAEKKPEEKPPDRK
jgi:proteasome lid subunit RPN8/RPN11